MSEINKNQKEFWSGKGGDIWVNQQEAMDSMLSPLGKAALDKLNLDQKENILDIGCGCGQTTLEIAEMIPEGKITGLDISVPMLERAKDTAMKKYLPNVSFECKDVQTDDLGNSTFTKCFSRFGVMFFEDPVRAFKNINSSLVDGGSLSFVCWQAPSLNPWQSLSVRAVKKYLDLPSPEPRSPGPFAFAESEYINSILKESNFEGIEIESHEAEVKMFPGRDLLDSAKDYLSINPVIENMIKDSEEDQRNKIINSVVEAFSPFYTPKGLRFPSATWLVTASK